MMSRNGTSLGAETEPTTVDIVASREELQPARSGCVAENLANIAIYGNHRKMGYSCLCEVSAPIWPVRDAVPGQLGHPVPARSAGAAGLRSSFGTRNLVNSGAVPVR